MLEVYKLWRPTPLYRAHRLEKALDTPAHIYYKYEGVSPAGSHKPNTAVAQAYYNKQEGIRRLTTETGAGQWGSALAMACSFFGLELKVYMVKVCYHQKPYRRIMMETWGAKVRRLPTNETNAGRGDPGAGPGFARLPRHRHLRGGRGRRHARTTRTTRWAACSTTSSCTRPSSARRRMKQMEMAGEYPDVVIGCVGGGSNFAGLAFPFMRDRLVGGQEDALRRRRAGGLPHASPAASTPTTSATRRR